MITEMTLRRRLAISAVTVLTLAGLLFVLLADPFGTEGVRYDAEFGHAGQGLGTGAPVKIRGVPVGTVSVVRLGDDGRARISLRLDSGVRVPDSVTASIEPASVFGPKFVDLIPGGGEATGPYLSAGALITRTSDPTDLSDLLAQAGKTVSAVDPAEVSIIVHTLAVGLGGQGPRLRATIDDTGTLLDLAYRHRGDARRFLTDGADLTATLAGSGGDLVAVSGDADTLISETAAGGRGRLGAFAAGLGDVSALLAHGLDKRGGQLGEAFRSGERAISVVYSQLGLLGDGVRAGNALLPVYNDLTRLPGPGGKHYLAVQAFLPGSPCELILGLCGPKGGR